MPGLIHRIVDSAHGLVQQRQQVAGHETIRQAALSMPKGKRIALPRNAKFFFPHLHRTTPWGGFLHMRTPFPELMKSLCSMKPPFLAVDTDYAAFGGSPFDTSALRSVFTGVILVRDFVLSGYQVDEARACGADGLIFPSWAWSADGTPVLAEACKTIGMHAFYQVSSLSDLDKLEYFSSSMVFVSWMDIGKDLRRNDLETMKQLVKAVGNKRAVVVDGPWDPEESLQVFTEIESRGTAYADGLVSGEDACKRIDAFHAGDMGGAKPKEQPPDPQSEIENQKDEVWVVIANMQMTQALLMPYPSEAEAARACDMLRKAWSDFRIRQGSRGDRPHGTSGVFEMPRGANGALYVVDLDTVASIVCVPGRCISQGP